MSFDLAAIKDAVDRKLKEILESWRRGEGPLGEMGAVAMDQDMEAGK